LLEARANFFVVPLNPRGPRGFALRVRQTAQLGRERTGDGKLREDRRGFRVAYVPGRSGNSRSACRHEQQEACTGEPPATDRLKPH